MRNLHEVYYDIFYLTRLGFSPEYIESISPAERSIYIMYNKMRLNKKDPDMIQNEKAANLVGLGLDDL